ncbi:MAG: hypothetical protein ACM3JD_06085, partial [Rudaea sp.]
GFAEARLLLCEAGEPPERDARLRDAKNACVEALRYSNVSRPGMPEAMRLQGTYEWLRGGHQAACKWWRRSLALAEKQGQRYDEGMTHLEIGKRRNDCEHLERAIGIFSEIGAEFDLARAREALAEIGKSSI